MYDYNVVYEYKKTLNANVLWEKSVYSCSVCSTYTMNGLQFMCLQWFVILNGSELY